MGVGMKNKEKKRKNEWVIVTSLPDSTIYSSVIILTHRRKQKQYFIGYQAIAEISRLNFIE